MPAKAEGPRRRAVLLARHLFTGGVLAAVACLAGCSGEATDGRKMSSPPLREDLPMEEAEATATEPAGAEALASVEAELAAYEARLARAGVNVERGARPLRRDAAGSTARPSPAEAERAESEPAPDTAADPAPTKTKSSSNKAGSGAKRPSSRPKRRQNQKKNEDADRNFAPAPPPSASKDASKPDTATLGGAVAGDEPTGEPRDALADEIEADQEASRIDPKPRCEELCSLADAICALEDRVCKLADEHTWDQRYADACTRASEDCDAAQDACTTCKP